MKNTAGSRDFTLSNAAIDEASNHVYQIAGEHGMQRREALRLRLSIEEMLLRLRDTLGESAACALTVRKRLSSSYIELHAAGDRLDLTHGDDDESARDDLLSMLGLAPGFHYAGEANVYTWQLPKRKTNPILALLIAIVSGLGTGFLLSLIGAGATVNMLLITPLRDAFLRALVAVSQVIILLSVMRSIYSMGRVAELGSIGAKTVKGYVFWCFLCSTLALALNLFFYPVVWAGSDGSVSQTLKGLVDMLLGVVPGNVVTPFVQGNVLQILFLACVMGLVMLLLGERAKPLKDVCDVLHDMFGRIMGFVMMGMYVSITLNLAKIILDGGLDSLLSMGGSLLLIPLSLAAVFLVRLISFARAQRVSPLKAWSDFSAGTLISLTTASSLAAYSTMMNEIRHRQGVDERLAGFGVPIGLILSKGALSAYWVALFPALMQNRSVPITGLTILILLLILPMLALAVPPVPGGTLSVYALILTQFGLPPETMGIILIIDMLMDYPITATDMYLLQTTVVRTQAKLRREKA